MRAQRRQRVQCWRPRFAVLAAALAALLVPGDGRAGFDRPGVGGPSVRVVANERVEIRWIGDFVGDGRVDVFASPDGTGPPIDVKTSPSPANAHTFDFTVGGVLAADTTYYFKVTHSDPQGLRGNLTNDPAPFPSFFTGSQAIGDVVVAPDLYSARISWEANVIGLGRIAYGIASPDEQARGDSLNVTEHSIELTGLQPGTTYQFRVSNRHALDGGSLAEKTGSFTTLSVLNGRFLPPLTQSTDLASPVVNTGKNGRVIPVKVQIGQGGTAITDLNAPGPVTISVSKLACGASAGSDPVSAYADAGQSSAGTNRFRYDAIIQAWVYNLDTTVLGLVTGNCYRVDVSVAGTPITNAFAVFQPTR